MPKPISLNLKLSKEYKRLVELKGNFKIKNTDYMGKAIVDKKGEIVFQGYPFEQGFGCCGLSEITLFDFYKAYKQYPENFPEIMAKAFSEWKPSDERVVIVGLVVGTSEEKSEYYDDDGYDAADRLERVQDHGSRPPEFYKECIDILKSFGFKQVNSEPYENHNSGNKIIAMIGQLR